jgi:hypothetical protein
LTDLLHGFASLVKQVDYHGVLAQKFSMIVNRWDENSVSGALVRLLQKSPQTMKVLLRLAKISAPSVKSLKVDHLHCTDDNHEIDILIHDKSFGIVACYFYG